MVALGEWERVAVTRSTQSLPVPVARHRVSSRAASPRSNALGVDGLRPQEIWENVTTGGVNKSAFRGEFQLHRVAPWQLLLRVPTFAFVENSEDVAKTEGVTEPPSRFDSGKWLKNNINLLEVGTKRQQIIVLPPYSVHARDRGTCQIRFRLNGKQVAISTGISSFREATAQADALLARWLAAHGETAVRGKAPLQAAVDAFLAAQYREQKRATREEAALVLRRFTEAFPVQNAQEITREVFQAGAKKLRGEASPKYWMNILSITRRFSRWLVEQGKIAQDFTVGVAAPARSSFGRREEVWEEDELAGVLAQQTPFDAEVLQVMRWTGMDSSDVATLEKRHIVKDDKGAFVIRKRREKGKSDEETLIQPMASQVREILLTRLKACKGPTDRLFGNGYVDSRSFTKSLLGRVRRAAGPTKDLKSLRHTFASYHAERGVPLDVLRVWMGHARDSRVLDRIYIHRKSTASFMD